MNVMTMPDRAFAARGRRALLVEGWRDSNHSYALVNQNQILRLLDIADLDLYHLDMPALFPAREGEEDAAGFAAADRARIAAVPAPGDAHVDAVLRIVAPARPCAPADRRKTGTFVVTEVGLAEDKFRNSSHDMSLYTRGENFIVTPSHWSRELIAAYGFPAEKIHILPHGVNTAAFYPLAPHEREACRAQLGLAKDEVVFLNVGGPFWNKGTDILLRAFAALRLKNPRVRLYVKDLSHLYGLTLGSMLETLAKTDASLRHPDVMASITVIPWHLNQSQLRFLYGIADCYVSPYRAEGFNLPVLEALACGIPIITTRGGATDDFCDDEVAQKIASVRTTGRTPQGDPMHYCDPDFEHLLTLMAGITANHVPSPAYQKARLKLLQNFTWREAARIIARLTVGIETPPEIPRPIVNSFDVFDTLIARRCKDQHKIFEQIAARVGVAPFAQARIIAESRLASQPYTLDDIYRQMQDMFQLPEAAAQALMREEISTELANVVPIAENLAKIEDGDVLICDTYLSHSAISALLHKAGHHKQTGLILSTTGKHQATVWPMIAQNFDVISHLGDDLNDDVANPSQFGIMARHGGISAPSHIENWLEQEGLRPLALLIREARLRSFHSDPAMRGLQNMQTQINFPIIFLACVQLRRVIASQNIDSLVFCSRDCELWLELFTALGATSVAAHYYYTSPISQTNGSADYLRYSRSVLKPRSMVVDIRDAGWSLPPFFASLGLRDQPVFLIQHAEGQDVHEAKTQVAETLRIHSAVAPPLALSDTPIRLMNTAEHGPVEDVRLIGDAVVPLFAPAWPENIRAAIRVQRQSFREMIGLLTYHDLSGLFDLPAAQVSSLIQNLYENLATQPVLREVFGEAYRR